MAEEVAVEEKPGFMDRIKAFFKSSEDEENVYKRKLIDRKIERYIDENFDSYIEEYGLVNELDLKKYDERFEDLANRVNGLKTFVSEADAELGNLEKRVGVIKKAAKGGKKK